MSLTIASFIDDTLMCSKSVARCYDRMQNIVKVLRIMRFCINEGKSILESTKHIEYLGYIIDSENMKVALLARRKGKIV